MILARSNTPAPGPFPTARILGPSPHHNRGADKDAEITSRIQEPHSTLRHQALASINRLSVAANRKSKSPRLIVHRAARRSVRDSGGRDDVGSALPRPAAHFVDDMAASWNGSGPRFCCFCGAAMGWLVGRGPKKCLLRIVGAWVKHLWLR